jgi:hypothetical protein
LFIYLVAAQAEKIKREKSEVKKELVNQTLPGRPSVLYIYHSILWKSFQLVKYLSPLWGFAN